MCPRSGWKGLALLACSASTAWGPAASAATTASQPVGATVLQPISVTAVNNNGIEFGNVLPVRDTITLTTTGQRLNTNSIALPGGLTPRAAQFLVTGAAGLNFSFDYDYNTTTLTLQGGSATMAVSWITEVTNTANGATGLSDPSSNVNSGTLSPTGTAYINVGAKLMVSAGQAVGRYIGAVAVTVYYD